MQFSFENHIDSKDHKSEDENKAIAVEGAIWPEALTRCKGCKGLAGSALQERELPPEH